MSFLFLKMADADIEESDEDGSDGWEECDSIYIEQQNVMCLFCSVTFSDAPPMFVHCRDVHSFNICHLKRLHSLDCIAYIKLVNFIRRNAS